MRSAFILKIMKKIQTPEEWLLENEKDSVILVEDCMIKYAVYISFEFAKWIDKNYFQGEKNNTYAKCKEDFLNKETTFSIKQLSVIFHANVLQADA